MSCVKFQENISAYVDNELSQKERERLEAHLKSCSACRAKVESMRELSNQIQSLPRIEGNLADRNLLIASLREKIALEPLPRIQPKRIPYKRFAFAGAFIIVLLAVGFYLSTTPRTTSPPFIFEGQLTEKEFALLPPVEEILYERMVELIKLERLKASEHEVFGEPVRGVFVSQPKPPTEGVYQNPNTPGFKG